MLFHVLDNLHLFGMEIEPSFFGRSINLFPFGERKENIFPTEAPYHDVVFPVAFEYRSLVVLQELLELFFITESRIKTLIEISCGAACVFGEVEFPVSFGSEVPVLWVRFGIEP